MSFQVAWTFVGVYGGQTSLENLSHCSWSQRESERGWWERERETMRKSLPIWKWEAWGWGETEWWGIFFFFSNKEKKFQYPSTQKLAVHTFISYK